FWNDYLERWTGIPRAGIIGTSIAEHFPYLNEIKCRSRLDVVLQGGPPAAFSFQFRKGSIPPYPGSGEPGIKHTVVTAIPSPDDGDCYAIMAMQDVTDLTQHVHDLKTVRDQALEEVAARTRAEEVAKKAYENEANLRRELETEIQKRLQLTRALVHEMKNPLASMMIATDLLAEELPQGRALSLVDTINRSTSSLNRMTGDLLDVARGEMGTLDLNLAPTDLTSLLRQICSDMAPVASRCGHNLVADVAPALPQVMADASRLRQVVLNLLGNAFKFTPRGGQITIRAREDGTGMVVAEVVDNGPGISHEQQNRVFELYYRTPDARQRTAGLGIGLALCKMLIELHGGRIWVKSSVGNGSTFGFSLPLPASTHGEERESTVALSSS
ncbi:MAG: PAS domain-containing sensor histidine kinase, partial [Chloroflexi bacterium]|nr:PAS domain-containing sensor histidine kinase [Chloroflexota bacterium]